MKIIALEEHFATPELMAAWHALSPQRQDISIKRPAPDGVDRRLLAEPNGNARRFLEAAELSAVDRSAIAHGNWERMCAAVRR